MGWIQDMLGLKDEDLNKPMFVRTKITIDEATLEKMAYAFGKGLRGESLTQREERYIKQANKYPEVRKMSNIIPPPKGRGF